MDIALQTQRLVLRRFTEADTEALAALYGDPAVMRFITGAPQSAAEVASEILPGILCRYAGSDGLGCLAAVDRLTGRFAGQFSLEPANSFGLTAGDGLELGYRLAPAFWGRGLATEGARALIDAAFGAQLADHVVATTMAVNTGSWRVLEKCGLRRVRTFWYEGPDLMPGAEQGDYVYELTRADWELQAGASGPVRS